VDEILIVLNKIDRVTVGERNEASAFSRNVLERRLQRPVARIYEVSALNRLNNTGDDDDCNALLTDPAQLAAQSGPAMTRSAAERGLNRYSVSLQRSIGERIRALEEPIASSNQRIETLRQPLKEAEQSLRDLGALFAAEQMRLSNVLLARRKQFLREVLPTARAELARECAKVRTAFGPARRREVMALAQAVARRHVVPWLETEEKQTEELYGAVTERFVDLINGLLRRIADGPSEQLSHLPDSLDTEQGFRGSLTLPLSRHARNRATRIATPLRTRRSARRCAFPSPLQFGRGQLP
jgi:hypothetical protein